MGLQKWKVLLLFIWTYFLFIGTSVFADTIVPINNRDRIGLGKFDTSIETFFGDFKTCSTDSYFYFVLVNESTRDVEVYLPQRVFANDQYRQIDPEGYFYKALNPENWKMDQFADANSGSKLFIADDFTFTLPALSVYSIKGHVIGLPSTDSRDTDTVEKDDKISGELALLIDGTMLTASGNFKEEGSICTTIQIIPFAGTNFVSANYDIAPTGEETCSLAYYFVIENGDPKYGSTVDLPHWIFIDDDRWNSGCQYIYSGCRISGFRHYAWAEIIDGKMPANADYHFCDQDKAYGDYCYEQDGIWWLNVPAGKRFAVRSMVNDLCSDEYKRPNPLMNNQIEVKFYVAASGGEKWWIHGEVFGKSPNDEKAADDSINLSFISRLEDRDPDEYAEQLNPEDILPKIIGNKGAGKIPSETISEEMSTKNINDAASSFLPASVISNSFSSEEFSLTPVFWNTFSGQDQCFPSTGISTQRTPLLSLASTSVKNTDLGQFFLEIPGNDVSVKIVGVPFDAEHSWRVEQLGNQAGLLEGSALPGEGQTVIAAHNHLSSTESGPFSLLNHLEANERLFIRKPDGNMLQYRVRQNLLVDADAFDEGGSYVNEKSLVLITCENETIDGGYQDRRIIIADPV